MYKHVKQIVQSGSVPEEAKQALIMLHGRGASAESIIDLADHFHLEKTIILAPQATNNSWYPYSFMVPEEQNQPALESALQIIHELVDDIIATGIRPEKVFFLGFSQGACLALEYAARNATHYGGIIAYTGGLIGANLEIDRYKGNFSNTPVLITTGDPDPHVPLSRVEESVNVFKILNADVTLKVYEGRVHTILQEEIDLGRHLIFNT